MKLLCSQGDGRLYISGRTYNAVDLMYNEALLVKNEQYYALRFDKSSDGTYVSVVNGMPVLMGEVKIYEGHDVLICTKGNDSFTEGRTYELHKHSNLVGDDGIPWCIAVLPDGRIAYDWHDYNEVDEVAYFELYDEVSDNLDTKNPLMDKWEHRSGRMYELLFLTNTEAVSDKYDITAVYRGDNGNLWSRPKSEWSRSFSKPDIPVGSFWKGNSTNTICQVKNVTLDGVTMVMQNGEQVVIGLSQWYDWYTPLNFIGDE